MVNAANLETRLSFEPPAPPPVDQTDSSRDVETQQGFEPAPVNTPVPAPATDSVDISDAARAAAPSTEVGSVAIEPAESGDNGPAQADVTSPAPPVNTEPLASENGTSVQSTPQTTTAEPTAQIENDPLASNQDSSLALEEAGNDTLNETEAGRTLGQVIDVFA